MTTATPLNAEQIEQQLEFFVAPVLSSRRTAAKAAQQLSAFDRKRQDFILRWVDIIAGSNAEMAYQFAGRAAQALVLMSEQDVEAWVLHAMDVYDQSGLYTALAVVHEIEAYAHALAHRSSGLALEEISHVLEIFVHGLNGRALKLDTAHDAYTDTETLFLPALIGRFYNRDDNFRLYKATLVHVWAQTWFGTWRAPLSERLARFPDWERATRWLHALEVVRLDARIACELPGMWRDMQKLRQATGGGGMPATLNAAAEHLQAPTATVEDSHAVLNTVYDAPVPPPVCYQGRLFVEPAERVIAARRERDKQSFRHALAKISAELRGQRATEAASTAAADDFAIEQRVEETLAESSYTLIVDGQAVSPPSPMRRAMDSITQDLGEIPPEYFAAAGAYSAESGSDKLERDPTAVWKGTHQEDGAFLYNEWDYQRRHYRKSWCVLREIDVHPQSAAFVAAALTKHRSLVKSLRRTFAALRGEDKLLKKQPHGDDIDIDALVEAYADTRSGLEMSDRLFTKRHKTERDIAVMLMVDMSGSTKGWINDAEREALVLLAESLETLKDRYAIYGFSGMTRKRCELYRIKRFDEPYDDLVKSRISGISPQDYTRMGVTIRHLSRLLQDIDARTKLLITLSDGKPDDYDGYRGTYGIEDTRMALIEAKRSGIHPFCITIDTEARDYLPHMYGAVNYTVIDEVKKLPLKVSDIYRRLTT